MSLVADIPGHRDADASNYLEISEMKKDVSTQVFGRAQHSMYV